MDDDDRVFKALADPTRRHLLDRLFERDGRTLTELESELAMTRFGVMKHLRVLEDAGLVVTPPLGPGEAALPQPGPDPADPRPVDRQVHGAPRVGARRPQARAGGDRMTHDDRARRRRSTQSSSRRRPSRSGRRSRPPSSRRSTSTARTSSRPATPDAVRRLDGDGRQLVDGRGVRVRPAAAARRTTWRASTTRRLAAEAESRVTWEIEPQDGGVTQADRRARPSSRRRR